MSKPVIDPTPPRVSKISTEIPGCFILQKNPFRDQRGNFYKLFSSLDLKDTQLEFNIAEVFFSSSRKNVIRGMHFQLPPHDHAKIVCCLSGRTTDVVLDLRNNSPTFGRAIGIELEGMDGKSLFIPSGCAHGFFSATDDSIVAYLVESAHSVQHDSGIFWRSIPFSWPNQDPVVSPRDSGFPTLESFKSPFLFSAKKEIQ